MILKKDGTFPAAKAFVPLILAGIEALKPVISSPLHADDFFSIEPVLNEIALRSNL